MACSFTWEPRGCSWSTRAILSIESPHLPTSCLWLASSTSPSSHGCWTAKDTASRWGPSISWVSWPPSFRPCPIFGSRYTHDPPRPACNEHMSFTQLPAERISSDLHAVSLRLLVVQALRVDTRSWCGACMEGNFTSFQPQQADLMTMIAANQQAQMREYKLDARQKESDSGATFCR